ncbi:MAG: M1 family metallopeptidase [Bacteroidetes bacterium]|nr:M1 family metallopeptidase [Bacteroidota bacterium]
MKFLFTFLSVILFTEVLPAQETEYRSTANPMYWKNRIPDGAYWQQDVSYKIDAKIDETTNIVDGAETLEYWNNSPDTLRFVYFHLWQNAFIKGSHLHSLEEAENQKARMGKYEKQGLGIVLEDVKADNVAATLELDNTILKVNLPKPLYPGAKVTFKMNFKTYYDNGSTRRRMQMWDAWGYKHYNGVQWFPKICVYDRKFGWDTQQHLNKEFYGDYGTYDVKLDFASNYVVEATGVLLNRKEALPDALREKLDVKNFKDKKWDEKPSEITPYNKDERKVWHYRAINVHDFAFTADPSYRLSTAYWNGIECVGIVQEPHASGWQNSGEFVAKIIQTFSEDIGMYQYPKMVAADARDGMEYPMLTLDGGKDPGYHGLLVHEIGHNWFYGQVGNNETYRAALDEGFTQFLTAWGLRRLDGENILTEPQKNWYKRMFSKEQMKVLDRSVENAYVFDALNQEELPINTHSDDFHNALGHEGGYRQVYYKTATMLYNLQYTLGDSLFQAALQHYFAQWRFAHPYFEDFRNSIIQFTHVDLNWFFDEWMETTKAIDYSIERIHKIKGVDSFAVTFRRRGQMQMPITFTVTAKSGSKHDFYIPNTWFEKQAANTTTLPKWYGWGKLHDTYTANIHVPNGVKNIQIDTSYRLADVYMLDNYKSRMLPFSPKALVVKFDGGLNNPWDRRHNRAYVRPDVWWNPIDGVKLGAHIEGDYLFTMHKIDASIWWNSHILQADSFVSYKSQGWYDKYVSINYSVNYSSPFTRWTPKLQKQFTSRWLDGLWYHKGGLSWAVDGANNITGYAQTMWRPLSYDRDYLMYPKEWSSGRALPNSSINLVWTHNYNYRRGNGTYKVNLRAPFLTGNSANAFNYSYAQLEAVNTNKIDKLEIRTRLFGRYGTGTNLPYESLLWLSGANPEELMENKYTRTTGFVPNEWNDITATQTNHFQQGGGMNLRGYAGYFVADNRGGVNMIAYKGRSGASANIEVEFDDYIKFQPKLIRHLFHLDVYLFADAGAIELSNASLATYWNIAPTRMWSDIRMDAGLGFALTIKNWAFPEKAKPLTLRFDMPLWLNRPPYANPEYTAFRYVVGVNKAF